MKSALHYRFISQQEAELQAGVGHLASPLRPLLKSSLWTEASFQSQKDKFILIGIKI